jgi:abortive infection bacteriophage resistance protein
MKRPFSKPATTDAQQIVLLQQRGMIIENPTEAEFYLQHLNYYRLGAYWLPFSIAAFFQEEPFGLSTIPYS